MADDLGAAFVAEDGLLDPERLFRSLNGFELIAVEQCFRRRMTALADDEIQLMLALMFIVRKREGMADLDAFRTTMTEPIEDVTARFSRPADEPQDPDLIAARDREYAEFVVGVRVSFMPDQFHALTVGQRVELLEAARRRDAA